MESARRRRPDQDERTRQELLAALEEIRASDGPRMTEIRQKAYKQAMDSLRSNVMMMLALLALAFVWWGFKQYNRGNEPSIHARGAFVIHGAKIYTVDNSLPIAGAFAVKDGRFFKVAKTLSDLNLTKEWEHVPRISLANTSYIVTPGFTDAHAHLIGLGKFLDECNLVGAMSPAEVRNRLRDHINKRGDQFLDDRGEPKHGRWLVGRGWDQTKFPTGEFPSTSDLDSDPLLRRFPIVLMRIDYHAYWLNNLSISLTINKNPTLRSNLTVPGGHIYTMLSGQPSGIFMDAAMSFVDRAKPESEISDDIDAIEKAGKLLLQKGITSYHDAMLTKRDVETFKLAVEQSRLPVRCYGMLLCDPPETFCGDSVERIDDYLGQGKFRLRAVKQFLDGALGSWGAAMWEPYEDKPDQDGIMRLGKDALKEITAKWIDAGWQVCTHAIGDRANSYALDAYEHAIRRFNNTSNTTAAGQALRLRIEHAQIVRDQDVDRFVDFGIIPSVQPSHATSDMMYAEKRIGQQRRETAYRWKSFLKRGVQALPLGSDFPVEHFDPLLGFYAAVTRLDSKGQSPDGPLGWTPKELLSREEALRGFTVDAAYASFQENVMGSIQPQKYADFVVWNGDIMSLPVSSLLAVAPVATYVGGALAHGKI
ncbi:hypothetical protein M427DRAFT_118087 [Gonapodya prolifera JEL478]|uniref:Amidohydrolase 3 domain-containing protein n=1 Tax=Gonapodya prolifera (strain JEL478) TaxID=1344416 RepID=A0A139AZE7_GONPJ|nr:hypothetical protein M427DRAFT_118087 [Gonapodya prolifera JEL478]|eukprot:KXS22084.1 hypothetical protein M427DRAFT_118087 [Gonapodya prolifera JEL478]